MDTANLVRMANRIGDFFGAMPDRAEALAGVANHLSKFWEPRMRRQILQALDQGRTEGLSDLLREALVAHRASIGPKP